MHQATVGRQPAPSISKIAMLVFAVVAMSQWSAAGAANAGAMSGIHVGIANHVKVAHWTPVQVEVATSAPHASRVSVTAPDNDGVAATASTHLPIEPAGAANRAATLYTIVGRLGTPIDVVLSAGKSTFERRTITANATPLGFIELPATAELLLYFGPLSPKLLDEHTNRNPANGQLARKAARAESVHELPDQWFGYDSVDLAVLTIGDGGALDAYCRSLAADEKRFRALVRWIELGGKLVIFCDGRNAGELLGEGRPLATLLPGEFAEVVRLPETGRLEHFAGSDVSIGGRGREPIPVPRLVDVAGRIEVYEGQRASVLPLVVRAPRGLGEIAFVAINPNAPPFVNWPGRRALIDAVTRPYLRADNASGAAQKLVTRGYNDLSGALRQNLGRSFAGVAPVSFPIVTVFAIAYLLVLGPLDYLLVRRWFRRTWTAWLTFPAIVLLFGGLALGLAERRQGGALLRINQLELVDVDATTGQARGTIWSAVYSPSANRLDVEFDVELLSARSERADIQLRSWALPGAGIGGTQAGGMNVMSGDGYRYGPDYDALIGVPVLTSGTKSLLARWTAPTDHLVRAELVDEDGLVTGSIENRAGRPLRNVRLYYGEWGYRLGTLAEGARINVDVELSPRSFKTIVTQDSLAAAGLNQAENHVFDAGRASLREIANAMMFYEAVGGFGFTQLPNRFQSYCDLSRLPALGRAVLVADVDTSGSRLVDAESGARIGKEDAAAVIYRFVLPVRQTK